MPRYQDIKFELGANSQTGVDLITNISAINQALKNIFNTMPGERIGDPIFGCNIKRFLFEKMNFITANRIKTDIIFAIETFEPRITLLGINVEPLYDQNQYNVFINYKINDLNIFGEFDFNLSLQET